MRQKNYGVEVMLNATVIGLYPEKLYGANREMK